MKTISVATLEKLKACPEQIAKFRAISDNGAIVPTRGLCLAHASVFTWSWAARKLLSPEARKAYGEATAPAWKAYDEAIALADKVYDEATAPAWKAYDEAIALADKVYDGARALARKVYDEATALAWFDAWESDQKA